MNAFLQDENDKVTSSPQGGDRTRKPHVWHKLVDYISVRYKGFCSRKKTYCFVSPTHTHAATIEPLKRRRVGALRSAGHNA